MKSFLLAAVLVLAACGRTATENAAAQHRGADPRPPNAPAQQPAFPGQTDAPAHTIDVPFEVVTVARGLEHPWGLAFLPDGRMLVTERPGRLRIVHANGRVSPPVAGLPDVDARNQGGLLDVALGRDFESSRWVYWCYAEPAGGGANHTAVARGRLVVADPPRLEGVEVIFRQAPSLRSTMHFGCRLVWAPDGTLFVTLGERSIMAGRRQAQQPDSLLGKVVRIHADGRVPADNPFVGTAGVRPEIWSIGHRNVQAAALHPATGELWVVEHGARGGDEINIVRKGRDYGWPTIAYGIEYSGGPIGDGLTQKAGMEQPIYYWDPVIAPSGMAFYTDPRVPEWHGSLFVGGLASEDLVRLTIEGDRVTDEERLLRDLGERIRDVVQGPDGALYLLTDEARGRVLKLAPRDRTD